MTIFIFGAGYSAQAFAKSAFDKIGATIYGTTRHKARFDQLKQAHIQPLAFDGINLTPEIIAALATATRLVISIAPNPDESDAIGDPLLRLANLQNHFKSLQWIGYLSTVGVYGDYQGRLVDETAPCLATLPRNQARIKAENSWQQLGQQLNIPIAIMRLAGIYGPGRNAFVKLTENRAQRIIKKGQFFSRIHVDDIAGSLHHFAGTFQDGIFNIADDEPAPPQDVITYAAGLMGCTPPPETAFEQAELSPMARSFYKDNKRISNKKLRASGYQLQYPNYQAALDAMWHTQSWRGV